MDNNRAVIGQAQSGCWTGQANRAVGLGDPIGLPGSGGNRAPSHTSGYLRYTITTQLVGASNQALHPVGLSKNNRTIGQLDCWIAIYWPAANKRTLHAKTLQIFPMLHFANFHEATIALVETIDEIAKGRCN